MFFVVETVGLSGVFHVLCNIVDFARGLSLKTVLTNLAGQNLWVEGDIVV